MKFSKLPLSLAVAAAVSTGVAYAGENRSRGSSVDIDKEIVYNQNINNSGQILTMGLILVDSSAAAVSEVKQKSAGNKVNNQFDTRNNASLSNDVLMDATGNIGVNVAAGDNNVQQNSVAIANASSASSTIDLHIDYTEGATHHKDRQTHDDYDRTKTSASADAWQVEGSASASHSQSMTDSVTVDAWSVSTEQKVSAKGDVTGKAIGGGIAGTSGSAAWGEYGLGGAGGGGVHFLNDKDRVTDNGEGGTTTLEGHESQGSFSASTSGSANGSAQFDSTEASQSAYAVSGSASHSESASDVEVWDKGDDTNETHDSDYRLNVAFDADFVFGGAADAETFSEQYAYQNQTVNNGVVNNARVGDNVGAGAAGNIGVNVAAGNSNVQTNQLALANNDGVLSTATASSQQMASGNVTHNNSLHVYETKSVGVRLSGTAAGTYDGTVTQDGVTYLDIWEGDRAHAGGTAWGHADLDFDEGGDANGAENSLNFKETGTIALDDIALAGRVNYREVRYQGHRNNASLGDNALTGASGNIGVNIAAGTNNLQGNALAISNASLAVGGGTGGE